MPYRRRLSVENFPFRPSSGIGVANPGSGETTFNVNPASIERSTPNTLSFGPQELKSWKSNQLVESAMKESHLSPNIDSRGTLERLKPELLNRDGANSLLHRYLNNSSQNHRNSLMTPTFANLKILRGSSSKEVSSSRIAERISTTTKAKVSLQDTDCATPPLNPTPRKHFIRNKRISPFGSLSIDLSRSICQLIGKISSDQRLTSDGTSPAQGLQKKSMTSVEQSLYPRNFSLVSSNSNPPSKPEDDQRELQKSLIISHAAQLPPAVPRRRHQKVMSRWAIPFKAQQPQNVVPSPGDIDEVLPESSVAVNTPVNLKLPQQPGYLINFFESSVVAIGAIGDIYPEQTSIQPTGFVEVRQTTELRHIEFSKAYEGSASSQSQTKIKDNHNQTWTKMKITGPWMKSEKSDFMRSNISIGNPPSFSLSKKYLPLTKQNVKSKGDIGSSGSYSNLGNPNNKSFKSSMNPSSSQKNSVPLDSNLDLEKLFKAHAPLERFMQKILERVQQVPEARTPTASRSLLPNDRSLPSDAAMTGRQG